VFLEKNGGQNKKKGCFMLVLKDRQFIELVHEIFGSTMHEMGFEFVEESKKLLYAKKGDIKIIFRLEIAHQISLFSLEIMLLGYLGERASPKPYYRKLAVTTIAKFSDPNYEILSKNISTEEELRESMKKQKDELLKYCKNILNEDIAIWSKIIDLVAKESGWSPD
jgi:hypothetical protein